MKAKESSRVVIRITRRCRVPWCSGVRMIRTSHLAASSLRYIFLIEIEHEHVSRYDTLNDNGLKAWRISRIQHFGSSAIDSVYCHLI